MFSVERVVATAKERCGLDDLGADTWSEGLHRLVDSLQREARLTEVGEIILGAQIEMSLVNRLQVVDWHRSNPQAVTRRIDSPVFILGLPRTGTTLLSYLLDADDANRSLLRWESFAAVPPPDRRTMTADPRFETAQGEMDALYEAAPQFKAIHYETAAGPTECVTLLGQDFRSVHYETLANIPSYGSWHESCDMSPAYEWHRSVLQVLQWSWPGRWVLKSPCHNLALDALDRVYPDARFVCTHRDPTTVVGSLASLVSVLSGLGTEHDFDGYIGRRWLDLATTMIDRFLAFRDRSDPDRFIDIDYRVLAADPLATARGVYDRLGWPWTTQAEQAMVAFVDDNPKGRFGSHHYDLAHFGLDPADVGERFAVYRQRFDLD
jgi:hypothetical protein